MKGSPDAFGQVVGDHIIRNNTRLFVENSSPAQISELSHILLKTTNEAVEIVSFINTYHPILCFWWRKLPKFTTAYIGSLDVANANNLISAVLSLSLQKEKNLGKCATNLYHILNFY